MTENPNVAVVCDDPDHSTPDPKPCPSCGLGRAGDQSLKRLRSNGDEFADANGWHRRAPGKVRAAWEK